jgi:dihydrofolate synthase/folylpolyglutamate synthase
MNYAEAIKYLYSVRLFGTKLGLANTKHLLRELGHPEEKFFTIHVAGTNGKGSVCALVSSILSEAGYRVGMFTSPHILSFRERIKVAQKMISEESVCSHLTGILPIIKEMSENPDLGHPTFFEIVTALAVDCFAASGAEVAVMETGMGGRLDATNALPSRIQVITTVGLEHTAYLGDSIPKIAWEKAGIIKEGATVIVGEEDEAATEVIRQKAAEKEARIVQLGEEIKFRNRELKFPIQKLDVIGTERAYPGIVLPLLGRHQAANCCMAVAVVEELQRRGFGIELQSIYTGSGKTRYPGRFEVIEGRPNIVLDAACNPHACKAVAETLSEVVQGAPLTIVAGFLRDKDYRTMCEILFPIADNIVLTRPKSQRALPLQELHQTALSVVPEKDVRSLESVEEAIGFALKVPPEKSFVCVTGSNYLLGPARKALGLGDLPEDFILSESFGGDKGTAMTGP